MIDKFENKIKYLRSNNVDLSACANISEHLSLSEISCIQEELEFHFEAIQKLLLIDKENDPHSIETAKRIARMYVREIFAGKYEKRPKMTAFDNDKNTDELFTIGPISAKSACAHHLVPFIGQVWIGVIPDKKLLGLSKYARLTKWVLARPHIQEEAVQMIANELEEIIEPKGLAVVMRAKHFCMCWRGVEEDNSYMTSSVVRGLLKDSEPRNEFFNLIKVH